MNFLWRRTPSQLLGIVTFSFHPSEARITALDFLKTIFHLFFPWKTTSSFQFFKKSLYIVHNCLSHITLILNNFLVFLHLLPSWNLYLHFQLQQWSYLSTDWTACGAQILPQIHNDWYRLLKTCLRLQLEWNFNFLFTCCLKHQHRRSLKKKKDLFISM